MPITTQHLTLPAAVLDEARTVAVQEGFPEVLRPIAGARPHAWEVTRDEAEHLRMFADHLQLRAELHHPYWDDCLPNHDPVHGENFHEVNMGLYETL